MPVLESLPQVGANPEESSPEAEAIQVLRRGLIERTEGILSSRDPFCLFQPLPEGNFLVGSHPVLNGHGALPQGLLEQFMIPPEAFRDALRVRTFRAVRPGDTVVLADHHLRRVELENAGAGTGLVMQYAPVTDFPTHSEVPTERRNDDGLDKAIPARHLVEGITPLVHDIRVNPERDSFMGVAYLTQPSLLQPAGVQGGKVPFFVVKDIVHQSISGASDYFLERNGQGGKRLSLEEISFKSSPHPVEVRGQAGIILVFGKFFSSGRTDYSHAAAFKVVHHANMGGSVGHVLLEGEVFGNLVPLA